LNTFYSAFNNCKLSRWKVTKKERTTMISANSDHEQATIFNLTETELEGIYGGWGHHGGRGHENDFRGGDRFDFRGGDRFDFRGGDRFGFRGMDDGC
jgi:hypothetical protein